MRDNFTQRTVELLAARAGYACSNPECQRSTHGATLDPDGTANVGVAAHITAASPGGPRYDPALSHAERQHHSNGIWLCQDHGKLVDDDEAQFPVETLREWKRGAEQRSSQALLAGIGVVHGSRDAAPLIKAARELITRLGLDAADDQESAFTRISDAARNDIAEFRQVPGWPVHTVRLNMRTVDGRASFQAGGLAAALEVFGEFTIVAPPGTGKTTTLVHLVEATLERGRLAGIFVPLAEWSTQSEPLFAHVMQRPAFRGMRAEHLMLLASEGRLMLAFDGWNELDDTARRRVRLEAQALRRHYPELRIAFSTRRQATDVPIPGDAVEIDELDETQQLEIARALRGDQGSELLDAAWRTPGVSELIAVPLYLTALLDQARGGTMPETKEEILRQFVTAHEAIPAHAEALHEAFLGSHKPVLTVLAVEATRAGNTVISDSRARAAVSQATNELVATLQLRTGPEPTTALNVFVNHHVVVRTGPSIFRFQHQQIQEWYASHDVERRMRASAAGDVSARTALRVEIFDKRPWEEAILFACERVSREGPEGAVVVADAVTTALSVDPMLAAAMIRRSAPRVWEQVADAVQAFVARWHIAGTPDRAFRFMVVSGRPEFSDRVWPLIENPDTQVHLRAMRSASHFPASVLGANALARLAALAGATRTHVLSELVTEGDVEALALATEAARGDPSVDVQLAVIEALDFRRADRHLNRLLQQASPELWARVAAQDYIETPSEPALAERLRTERQRLNERATDPRERLGAVLLGRERMAADDGPVADAIADPAFDLSTQNAGVTLHQAFATHPAAVAAGLLRRLQSGMTLPFRAEEMLTSIDPIDNGAVAELALNLNSPKTEGHIAATLAGPRTVSRLLDAILAAVVRVRPPVRLSQGEYDQYRLLTDRLAAARPEPFFEALLSHQGLVAPDDVGLAAELIARHGGFNGGNAIVGLTETTAAALSERMRGWAETLIRSPDSDRRYMADLAIAIGRVRASLLLPQLKQLLDEDLSRWRVARAALQANLAMTSPDVRSRAMTSWTLQFRQAFALMHGDAVTAMLGEYLEDEDFGFDAACAMKARWDRANKKEKPNRFGGGPDFSEVSARRAERGASISRRSPPEADLIWAAGERLLQCGASERRQRLALGLGAIGLSLPHGERRAAIDALLALPLPIRDKQHFLTALVLDGDIVDAALLLQGLEDSIARTNGNTALLQQNLWQLNEWLRLLPFSGRPAATLEGLAIADAALRYPHELDQLVSAVGYAPNDEAEQLLDDIAAMRPGLSSRHEWLTALLRRDTVSAALRVIDAVARDADAPLADRNISWIARELAALGRRHPDLKAQLRERYRHSSPGFERALLESTLAEFADAECTRALLQGYVAWGRRFDGALQHALREAAVQRRPVDGASGVFNLEPVILGGLRGELLAMLGGAAHVAALAAACLRVIDELRDEYGAPEFEPRHPDVNSDRTWPVELDPRGLSR